MQFPFGQPLKNLVQIDRRPKSVFVLGVYASAVHARWISPAGRDVAKALAVASEPYIFWRGENAQDIISQISIPQELGRLVPADPQFNGPSGIALDELFLKPLGVSRDDAWLCDLVPHSCVNDSQRSAIERCYVPIASQYHLPMATVPPVPNPLANDTRRQEILGEICESRAETLVLLGDKPIEWFLSQFDSRKRLSDFEPYGARHKVNLGGTKIDVVPLVHPRQAAQLGRSSNHWFERHQRWLETRKQDGAIK